MENIKNDTAVLCIPINNMTKYKKGEPIFILSNFTWALEFHEHETEKTIIFSACIVMIHRKIMKMSYPQQT